MQDYRNLKVWQSGHNLTMDVYRVTSMFPDDERFGLISQMRRCAVSISSNLAEGSAKNSDSDFRRYVHIAMGSAAELDYQLFLVSELSYLPEVEYQKLSRELNILRRMLNAFSQKLKADSK